MGLIRLHSFIYGKGEEASFVPAKKLMSSFSSTFASVTRPGLYVRPETLVHLLGVTRNTP